MSEEEKIIFDIQMKLYDEFNDTFCQINEHLGDIYSYKDLEDVRKAEKDREIQLLKEAVIKQQTKIDKGLKFIKESRYTEDNGCGYEWECMDGIDELVSILKGE